MERMDAVWAAGITGSVGLVALAVVAVSPTGFDSTTEAAIRTLNHRLLAVAIPIVILVEGLIVYTVVRFRGSGDVVPTPDNRRLEVGWTVATAVVLLFVGVASLQTLALSHVSTTATHHGGPSADGPIGDETVHVRITAQQWFWSVRYPSAAVSVRRAQVIYLPVDRPLLLTVTSRDVIHSFHAPGLGLKQDAMPGQAAAVRTEITNRGEYRL